MREGGTRFHRNLSSRGYVARMGNECRRLFGDRYQLRRDDERAP